MTTQQPKPMTLEQVVREVLSAAIREGLVAQNWSQWNDPDPQSRSAGELVRTANLLRDLLRR